MILQYLAFSITRKHIFYTFNTKLLHYKHVTSSWAELQYLCQPADRVARKICDQEDLQKL